MSTSRASEIDYVEYLSLARPHRSRSQSVPSEDEPNDFRVEIEIDRDSLVDVTVNIISVLYRLRTTLSAMLERGHTDSTNSAVREAIARIKNAGG